MTPGPTQTPATAVEMQTWLAERVAYYLNLPVEEIAFDVALPTYGLDSVYALSLSADIEDLLGIPLEATLIWDLDTIAALAEHLVAGGSASGSA